MTPTNDDSIEYSGPAEKITPAPGHYRPTVDGPVRITSARRAPIEDLRLKLQQLEKENKKLIEEIEDELIQWALPVTDDPRDSTLKQAIAVEWPASLGDPKNVVTYSYYKALKFRDTAASRYIRRRYEEVLRDVTGTVAIDMILLMAVVEEERVLVQNFIDNYYGIGDDTSEFQSVSLFSQWVDNAVSISRTIRKQFEKRESPYVLPSSEVDGVSTTDAQKAQAVFKVKINSVNDTIVRLSEQLFKTYVQYASLFYSRFYGPAMEFRLQVSRNVYPTQGGTVLDREVTRTVAALDVNIQDVFADQLRRNNIFNEKMDEILALVSTRDKYRDYIHQLAAKGKSVDTGQTGTAVKAKDTKEELVAFQEIVRTAQTAAPNNLQSAHAVLAGREDDTAHPQYLLKGGDTITGDLTVLEGVRIDGIDISEHRHNGADGSPLIPGGSIVPGTLPTNAVDTSAAPPPPTGLRIVSQNSRLVPSGLTMVDVVLEWDGPSGGPFTYEVNVAPVD